MTTGTRTSKAGSVANAATAASVDINALGGSLVGYAQLTADSSTFTTLADITGLSFSYTLVANRFYKLEFSGLVTSSVTNDVVRIYFGDGGTNISVYAQELIDLGADWRTCTRNVVFSGSAGATTFKVSGQRMTGSGSCKVADTSGLWLYDVGPTF